MHSKLVILYTYSVTRIVVVLLLPFCSSLPACYCFMLSEGQTEREAIRKIPGNPGACWHGNDVVDEMQLQFTGS